MLNEILFIGCGKMGGAILQRINGFAKKITVIKPTPLRDSPADHVIWCDSVDKVTTKPDVIIIAIKPQQIAQVLPAYARFKSSLFLSIATGKSLDALEHILGADTAIIRTMPNSPSKVGAGMTAAMGNHAVTDEQKKIATNLLHQIGKVLWVADEGLFDPITALSGSGPAYVFALVEAMTQAGMQLGIAPDMAEMLARQTVIGAGALLSAMPESAEQLRAQVTSPNGTTAAAMAQLLAADGLNPLILKTIRAAETRSKELAE